MERMTRQRLAIMACFQKRNRPLNIEEIVSVIACSIPDISTSTVYRNLKLLMKDGKIQIVNIPGGETRYELVKHTHHHHFHCQSCNCLYNIEGCPQGIGSIVPEGFKMIDHHITLSGYCKNCLASISL